MPEKENLKATLTPRGCLTGNISSRRNLRAYIESRGSLVATVTMHGQMSAQIIGRGSLQASITSRGQLVGSIAGVKLGEEEYETYMLVYDDGTEVPAVFVENEVTFTATENDIRKGTIAATTKGVTEGTKEIPSYNTSEGVVGIPKGGEFIVRSPKYDYTKFQGLICMFNTSLANSTATEKVAINDHVYNVGSHETISTLKKDDANKAVLFGLKNDTDTLKVIRYFMYREDY